MRARVSSRALALAAPAALATLAAAGCDWRTFDDLKGRTPVLAVGAPAHYGSEDFGRTLVPISNRPTGGRFVVSGAGAPAVAIIDLDAAGNAHGKTVDAQVFGTQPITALAEVPGTNEVLMGASGGVAGTVYLLTLGDTPDAVVFDTQPLVDRFGLGVAAGQLAGGDAPELVVAGSDSLTVYVDHDVNGAVPAAPPPAACPIAMSPALAPRDQLRRPVLVAHVTADPGNQIVVGTPTSGDLGAVSVFTVDATGAATCAFAYRGPDVADARFGQALAIGDFDADTVPDLLIGAPPKHAFWVKGPLTAASPVLPVTLAASTGDELGEAVAAVDVDGKAGDEALVGNPDATVGSDALAGEVQVVTGPMLTKALPTVRRAQPSTGDAFGIALAALPFCGPGCGTHAPPQPVALMGSSTRALTFFSLGAGGKDPRSQ
jgi:hypothetical protein